MHVQTLYYISKELWLPGTVLLLSLAASIGWERGGGQGRAYLQNASSLTPCAVVKYSSTRCHVLSALKSHLPLELSPSCKEDGSTMLHVQAQRQSSCQTCGYRMFPSCS